MRQHGAHVGEGVEGHERERRGSVRRPTASVAPRAAALPAVAVLAAALLGACAGSPSPEPSASEARSAERAAAAAARSAAAETERDREEEREWEERERYEEREEAAPPSPEEQRAVNEALEQAGRGEWSDLELRVDCRREGGKLDAVTVWGSGTAIWNRRRQFEVDREVVRGLLDLLRTNRFAALESVYGDQTEEEGPMWAVCRVGLHLDEVSKEVTQLLKGRQSDELLRIGRAVLDRLEPLASGGVTAESLTDGLRKIGSGELAPEALSVIFQRKPEYSVAGDEGFLLRIEGRDLEVLPTRVGEGFGAARTLTLTAGDLAGLAERLTSGSLAELPVNLWADHTVTDLTLIVLDQERRVQARPFTGMDASTHGAAQKTFDAVAEALTALAERGLAEGKVVGEPAEG